MSSLQKQYAALCGKLGVKPKQFGVLAGSASVAIVILGARTILMPSKASASPAPSAPAAATAAAAPAPAPNNAKSAFAHGLPARLAADLQERPARDPFVAAYGAASAGGEGGLLERAAASVSGTSGPPTGVRLQATLNASMGVINDNTYRVGDSFCDGEGRTFTVSSIGERSIRVAHGATEWTLTMGGPLASPGKD